MREHKPNDPFEGLFDDELSAALEAAAAEHRDAFTRHLLASLDRVRLRRTPLRGAEPFGTDGTVRLRFADGTTILARGDGAGGIGIAAVAMLRGVPVLLTHLHDDGTCVRAVLGWAKRHHTEIRVMGGDQPG
ncbi:hypothetical protein LKO27_10715 [Tessaracoccus sp. OS52]|uniref:hypothetical protein n=1 Tax=Tessaracoccus sp. OS52 TaxID=2886691 RepID=UPI001D105735|nr:hypothetical protein [Tessaracoccus sp. OS52]MCC2593876.1 hypothetical protein [Tessaracoccus sp. OS52]